MLKIHNVRLGLATNSSSSHSLVFIPPGSNVRDTADNEFGWDFFTASERETKVNYLSLLLWYAVERSVAPEVARMLSDGWLGTNLQAVGKDFEGHIDHQSVYSLPRDFRNRASLDEQFFMELRDFFLQDDLVICGGNDNTDAVHELVESYGDIKLPLSRDECDENIVARKDSRGYWVVFNGESGNKVRFSFGHKTDLTEDPDKADVPELVDVKITDYCPLGCKFCYQDSTTKGKHAAFKAVERLAIALGDLRVFEVALGGGEPTMHPDFEKILRVFRENGVVPNFTTKSIKWLEDDDARERILQLCGNFAYSVESAKDVKRLVKLLERHNVNKTRVNVHVVNRTVDGKALRDILEAVTDCSSSWIRVTLLGYKTTGRGEEYSSKNKLAPDGEWLDVISKMREEKIPLYLSIDTVLADQYQKEIKKAGVPDYLFHTQEGKFSAYIDAVAGKMGPSSFCPAREMRKLPAARGIGGKIKEVFSSF